LLPTAFTNNGQNIETPQDFKDEIEQQFPSFDIDPLDNSTDRLEHVLPSINIDPHPNVSP
jgi:hypothetical protein